MEQGNDYYAFISYKREDEKWAKWIQKELEHYRFPTNLNGRTDLPKNIRPIFKDTSELAGGVLEKEIHDALEKSKYLIVICSPRAAQSKWVGKEVQTFIELERTDKIIPFIIGGTPFSETPEDECFPMALLNLPKEQELLGVNINEMGRDAAIVKVVARMFDLKFDTLWQRYNREKKRKNRLTIGLLTFVVFVALFVAGWIWNQNVQLKKKDWNLMTQKARLMAKHVDGLINGQGNDVLALLLLEILPENIDNPDRPLVPEAEAALRRLLANYGNITNHHAGRVNFACYSPDGQYIVSVSDDTTMKIWDAKTGYLLNEPATLSEPLRFVSFSKDGKSFVSVSGKTVSTWDVNTGKLIKTIDYDGSGGFNTAYFSPNGDNVLITKYKTIIIKDINTLEDSLIINRNEDNYSFLSASYSPNGKRIVVTMRKGSVLDERPNHNIRIYDAETGELINTLEGHIDDHVNSAFYSSDGKYIVSASGDAYDFYDIDLSRNTVKLWDAETGQLIRTMKGHKEKVTYAAFSPDNKMIISSSGDGTIKIWNTNTGSQLKNMECHNDEYVSSAMFSPDCKRVVSASYDSTVVISQLSEDLYEDIIIDKKDKIINAIYNPQKEVFMTIHNNKIKMWDNHTKCIINTIPCGGIPVSTVFSPDGSKIAMGVDGTLKIWDLKYNKWHNSFPGRYEQIITFNHSGEQLLTTDRGCDIDSAFVWDINNGALLYGWEINEFVTTYAIYNHIGSLLATGYMDYAKIWDFNKKEIKYFNDLSFDSTTKSVSAAAFSKDDLYLKIGCTDGSILTWDLQLDSLTHQTANAHNEEITSINYSPNGKYYLTTSHDSFVKVWDSATNTLIQSIDIKIGETISASFNSNGDNIMVCSSNNKVIFVDFPPLQQLINEIREKYKNRTMTSEERQKYYLE